MSLVAGAMRSSIANAQMQSPSRETLEEALQRPGEDIDRVLQLAQPPRRSPIVVFGQIVLGALLPWMGPKSSE